MSGAAAPAWTAGRRHGLERAAAVLGGKRKVGLDAHFLAAVKELLHVRRVVRRDGVDAGIHDAQRDLGGNGMALIVARRDRVGRRLARRVCGFVGGDRDGQLLLLADDGQPQLLLVNLMVLDDGDVDGDGGEVVGRQRDAEQGGRWVRCTHLAAAQTLAFEGESAQASGWAGWAGLFFVAATGGRADQRRVQQDRRRLAGRVARAGPRPVPASGSRSRRSPRRRPRRSPSAAILLSSLSKASAVQAQVAGAGRGKVGRALAVALVADVPRRRHFVGPVQAVVFGLDQPDADFGGDGLAVVVGRVDRDQRRARPAVDALVGLQRQPEQARRDQRAPRPRSGCGGSGR